MPRKSNSANKREKAAADAAAAAAGHEAFSPDANQASESSPYLAGSHPPLSSAAVASDTTLV